MFTCTKKYTDFPFAHRQHNHDGHCRLIHGHNWAFEFEFKARILDENNFVVDFGKLDWLKAMLTEMFDHTLVLNNDDPALVHLTTSLTSRDKIMDQAEKLKPLFPFAAIRYVPSASCEGIAQYIAFRVQQSLTHPGARMDRHERGVTLVRVTVYEDSKNSATYTI